MALERICRRLSDQGRKAGRKGRRGVKVSPGDHDIEVVYLPTFSLDTLQVYKVAVDGRLQCF